MMQIYADDMYNLYVYIYILYIYTDWMAIIIEISDDMELLMELFTELLLSYMCTCVLS